MTPPLDLAALRALLARAPRPRWKVYERPLTVKAGWEDVSQSLRVELRIGSEDNHPQLKAPEPIVTTTKREFAEEQHGIYMSRETADLIVAAVNALPALLDRLERAEEVLEALGDAVQTLNNVCAVSHECSVCVSYETAHAALSRHNGFKEYFSDDAALTPTPEQP